MKNLLYVAVWLLLVSSVSFSQAKHTFSWQGENFLLDGEPFLIRAGEMHYPRVPRAMWRDRFRKAKALGLNTITTYIFWDLHEPKPGKFDFKGNLDVAEFIREANEEGLYVIVRPGPYICTEWDFGGLPAWLLAEKDMKARTADPRFLAAAGRYMAEVGRQLKPLEMSNGGNILMVQVENEYGSFGADKVYLEAVRQMIKDAGFTSQLYTSDGSADYMLKNGTLPDTLSVINFGAGEKTAGEFENFAKFRQNVPRMTGEYWVGWFDHWGEKHHTVNPEVAANGVDWMLKNKVSFNLYMFHGGTSFGFMNGANYSKNQPYSPDISSYDYDSLLDESGQPTPKYYAVRSVIEKYLAPGEKLPEVPATSNVIEIPSFELNETADFFTLSGGKPTKAQSPLSMEETGQSYGFILYRKKLEKDAAGELKFNSVRDYAHLFNNGTLLGKLDRRSSQNTLPVNLKKGDTLDVLVENTGRLNFGKEFIYDRKGIIGNVSLANENLENWEIYNFPLDNLGSLKFKKAAAKPNSPTFYRGYFDLQTPADTYLDTTAWGKGHVWVNGHHLGRFWKIGPQQTLYVPASFMKAGKNEVIVLDVDQPRQASLRGVKQQIFANQ